MCARERDKKDIPNWQSNFLLTMVYFDIFVCKTHTYTHTTLLCFRLSVKVPVSHSVMRLLHEHVHNTYTHEYRFKSVDPEVKHTLNSGYRQSAEHCTQTQSHFNIWSFNMTPSRIPSHIKIRTLPCSDPEDYCICHCHFASISWSPPHLRKTSPRAKNENSA